MPVSPNEILKPCPTSDATSVHVICVGAQRTLEKYIKSCQILLELPPGRITAETIRDPGTPGELVSRAIEALRYGAFRSQHGIPGNAGTTEVWIAFDAPDDRMLRKMIAATRNFPDIHLLPSSPCAELWFLLHWTAADAFESLRTELDGKPDPAAIIAGLFAQRWEALNGGHRNLATDLGKEAILPAMRGFWPVAARQPDPRLRTYIPELIFRLLLLKHSREEACRALRIPPECLCDASNAETASAAGEPSEPALFETQGARALLPRSAAAAARKHRRPKRPAPRWRKRSERQLRLSDLVRCSNTGDDDRLLILSEGSKTELNYIDGLIDAFGLPRERVRMLHPKLFNPLHQVREAARMLIYQDCFEKDLPRRFSEIWLVFDRDEHGTFEEALAYALQYPAIHLAASDPCVELWFLHHRTDRRKRYAVLGKQIGAAKTEMNDLPDGTIEVITRSVHRRGGEQKACIGELKSHLPGYQKNCENIYERLGTDGLIDAMRRDWPVVQKQNNTRCEPWTLMPGLVVRLMLLRYSPEEVARLLMLPEAPPLRATAHGEPAETSLFGPDAETPEDAARKERGGKKGAAIDEEDLLSPSRPIFSHIGFKG